MLRFSKKVEYALIAMLHISDKGPDQLTTARELSETYDIPLELMGKVLQQLARNGFIGSYQGVKGGYNLTSPIDDVTVRQIVGAVDGPFKIVSCLEHRDDRNCGQLRRCNIKNPMQVIQNKLELFFNNLTIKDLQRELVRQS